MKPFLLLAVLLSACATTKPPSPPSYALTGYTFDCSNPTVSEERPKADGIVGDCLVAVEQRKCIDSLASWYHADTLGCSVRSQGVDAFEKMALGTATDRDRFIAAGSKQWINSEGVGYR